MSDKSMSIEQSESITKTVALEKGKLLSFIRKRVRGKEEAEDILQDVFVQLVNVYQSIGSIERVASWLYKVANNKIIDASRKKKAASFSSRKNDDKGDDELSIDDLLPDLGNSVEDQLLQELIWDRIQIALSELPEEQRDVFVWHELENLSYNEISKRTGLSENTLFSRKRYAIQYLRKQLLSLYQEL